MNKGDVTLNVQGHPFTCPESLLTCVIGVLKNNEYGFPDLPETRAVKSVLDIGANVGSFVRWFDALRPGCVYHCFEPHPGAREYLAENVKRQSCAIHPFAVARGLRRSVPFYEGSDWGLNTLEPNFRSTEKSFVVQTFPPENLPACDVLKIDAEGVELEILEAYPYLDRATMVILEYHREEDRRPIEDQCLRAGLRCFRTDQLLVSSGRMIWIRSAAKFSYRVGAYVRPEDWP